jgi:GTP-binding protein
MAKQTRQAVAEADAVIFVVDVRGGCRRRTTTSRAYLRTQQEAVVLAANKAEGMTESPLLAEFHELGIGEPHPVSSAHGQGIRSLLEAALVDFSRTRRRRRRPPARRARSAWPWPAGPTSARAR